MICKWCGAELAAGASKCSRCGKEIPALSDCGGFYDLVPGANRLSRPGADFPGGSLKAGDDPVTPIKPMNSHKSKVAKGLQKLTFITYACFAVLLVLIVVLFIKISGTSSQIEDLQNKIDQLSEAIPTEATDPSDSGNTSSPADSEKPDYRGKDIKIEFVISSDDDNEVAVDGSIIRSAIPLPEELSPLEVNQDKSEIQCSYKLPDFEEDLIAFQTTESANFGGKNIVFNLAYDLEVFGSPEGDPTCELFCRTSDDEDWSPVESSPETVGNSGLKFRFPAEEVSLLYEDDGDVEIRLVFTQENEDGGKLTVTVITSPKNS